MRRLLTNAGVFGLTLVVTVASCELGARWADPNLRVAPDERVGFCDYDATLGWVNRPGAHGRFAGTSVSINAEGFRDGEHRRRAGGRRRRVVVLGDSFVWGYRVEAAERFTDLLAVELPDTDVLNFGCSGYGQDQEYLLLQREFDRYGPDVVVVAVHVASDLENDVNSFQYGYHKPYFELDGDRLVVRNVPVPRDSLGTRLNKWMTGRSALWNLVGERTFGAESLRAIVVRGLDGAFASTAAAPVRTRVSRVTITCRLTAAIERFATERGAAVLVVLIPNVDVADQSIERDPDYDALRGCLTGEGLRVLDLGPVFRDYLEANDGAAVTLKGDRHWSPEGHAVVARALGERLTGIERGSR